LRLNFGKDMESIESVWGYVLTLKLKIENSSKNGYS
jgi:hypothetical protein